MLRVEFESLVAQGAFEGQRIELLRGNLVTLPRQSGAHATISSWLAQRLIRALDETFDVRAHSPFAATHDSQPQPDISVAHRSPGFEHPSDALLIVEVSDTSLEKDRTLKAPIYAEARVSEYWIVDISTPQLVVHVHTRPTDDGYRQVETLRAGDTLRPTKLPGVEIAIADIP